MSAKSDSSLMLYVFSHLTICFHTALQHQYPPMSHAYTHTHPHTHTHVLTHPYSSRAHTHTHTHAHTHPYVSRIHTHSHTHSPFTSLSHCHSPFSLSLSLYLG